MDSYFSKGWMSFILYERLRLEKGLESNHWTWVEVGLKGSVVKITLKHGLKPGIFLKKRFGRFLWFFRSVIYNPSRKMSRLDFSCKSLYLIVFVHLKKPWHILDIHRTPRNNLSKIFTLLWTQGIFTQSLDWILWKNGHSASTETFSKART